MDSARAIWVIAATAAIAALYGIFLVERPAWSPRALRATTSRHWNFGKWLTASALMQWTSGSLFTIAAGYRRYGTCDFGRAVIVNVSRKPGLFLAVHVDLNSIDADIDYNRPGFYPVAFDHVGPADSGYQDIRTATHIWQILGATVANRYRRICPDKQTRHRLADNI